MGKKKVYSIELSKDEAEQFIAAVKQAEKEDNKTYLYNVSGCYDNILIQIICSFADLQYFNQMVSECF